MTEFFGKQRVPMAIRIKRRRDIGKDWNDTELKRNGTLFRQCENGKFFATLKKEKIYRIAAYKKTREEVRSIVFRYIFIYYNRKRISTVNPGGLSPVAYRERMTKKLPLVA